MTTQKQTAQVGEGDRLLDIACGSGLAMELAAARGATVAGIDASSRPIAVARDRVPDADVRTGDMAALPWEDDAFDVVTSFRGLSCSAPTSSSTIGGGPWPRGHASWSAPPGRLRRPTSPGFEPSGSTALRSSG